MKRRLFLEILFFVAAFTSVFGQNVGIGTNVTSRARLEVHGVAGAGATSAFFSHPDGCISFQRNWPTIGFNQYRDDVTPGSQGKYFIDGAAAIQYFDPNTGTMIFDVFAPGTANAYTPAADRAITITFNGNVGLRTANTTASLVVGNLLPAGPTAVFKGTNPDYHTIFNHHIHLFSPPIHDEHTRIRGGKAGSAVYVNDAAGLGNIYFKQELGINNNTLTGALTIKQFNNTGIRLAEQTFGRNWQMVVLDNQTDPGSDFYLFYNGTNLGNFYHGDGIYYSYSDKRLKSGIQPLQSVLPGLLKLRPVYYRMNDEAPGHHKTIGFIAQDVRSVFPVLVKIREDVPARKTELPGIHSMNYDGLNILSIKAIQEQQRMIRLLEQEQQTLLIELGQLESRKKQNR